MTQNVDGRFQRPGVKFHAQRHVQSFIQPLIRRNLPCLVVPVVGDQVVTFALDGVSISGLGVECLVSVRTISPNHLHRQVIEDDCFVVLSPGKDLGDRNHPVGVVDRHLVGDRGEPFLAV